MKQGNDSAQSPFHGHIDTTRIGAVGHSAGGTAVEELAAADPSITTFVGLAGASPDNTAKVPRQPGLLMVGTADTVVPEVAIAAAFERMHAPKRLVLLKGAGHLAFADICEVGAGQGGLLSIADALKVPIPASLRPLATDGCQAPDLPPPQAWPAIRQTVTAWLRHAFDFDASDAGYARLKAAFPDVVTTNRSK
jgi:predicted dienelactone hydrolase